MVNQNRELRARLVGEDRISSVARKARKELRDFERQLASLQGRGSRATAFGTVAREIRKVGDAADRAAAAESKLQRARAAGNPDAQRRSLEAEFRATQRITRALRDEETRRRSLQRLRRQGLNARAQTAEAEAQERVARAARRQAVAQAEVNQRRRQGLVVSTALLQQAGLLTTQVRAQEIAERAVANQKLRQLSAQRELQLRRSQGLAVTERLRRAAGELEASDRRRSRINSSIFFTFRRLVGVLAAFTIARNVVFGFQQAIRSVVEFVSRIEVAELSVKTLLTATTQLTNTYGELVPQSAAFARNQFEARRQLALLRQDSLRTLATFDQLVDTFQVAIAPGRAAGLDIDQIRQLSVRISQVAGAIGLAQNQLAEEIRSILSGTIQLRTTRIAAALGITNEDVRNARSQGELFAFLNQQFSAFALSGGQARQTLQGLRATITDLFGQAGALAGQDFFSSLRRGLRALAEEVIGIGSITGELQPNPEFIAFLETIFDFLGGLVDKATDFVTTLDFEQLTQRLQGFAEVTATLLSLFSDVAGNLATLLGLLTDFVSGIGFFFGGDNLQSLLSWVITLRLLAAPAIFSAIFRNFGRMRAQLAANSAQFSFATIAARGFRIALEGLKTALTFGIATLATIGLSALGNSLEKQKQEALEAAQAVSKFRDELTRLNFQISDVESFEELRSIREQLNGVIESARDAGVAGRLLSSAFEDVRAVGTAEQTLKELRRALERSALRVALDITPTTSSVQNLETRLQSQIGKLELQIGRLSLDQQRDPLNALGLQSSEQQLEVQRELARLTAERGVVQERLFRIAAEARGLDDQERQSLTFAIQGVRRLDAAYQDIAEQRQQLARQDLTTEERAAAQDALRRAQSDSDSAQRTLERLRLSEDLAKLAAAAVNTQGQFNTLERDTNALKNRGLELDRAQLEIALRRLDAQARINRAENDSRARTAIAGALFSDTGDIGSVRDAREALGQLATARAQLLNSRQQAEQEEQILQFQIRRGQEAQINVSNLEEQLRRVKALNAAEEVRLENAERAAQLEAARALERRDNGFAAGVRDFVESVGTLQDGLFALAQNFTSNLSSGLTNALVAAVSGGDVNAAIQQLGLRLIQSTIQVLIDQLLASILGSLLPSLAGGATTAAAALSAAAVLWQDVAADLFAAAIALGFASTGSGAGLATGGAARGGLPGGAHARAPGFSDGGRVPSVGLSTPPAGVDRRDTLAAWLRPGEHVMRPEAVGKYGRAFMDLVNTGRLPASLAKAMSRGVASEATPKAPSFATGGFARGRSVSGTGNSRRSRVSEAVILSDERTMDRFMRGGADRHRQRVGQNKRQYRAELGLL